MPDGGAVSPEGSDSRVVREKGQDWWDLLGILPMLKGLREYCGAVRPGHKASRLVFLQPETFTAT